MKNAVVTREKGKTWTVNCTKKFLLREISFKSEVIRDQKLCWWLSVQAPLILVYTWHSSMPLDRDNGVDRVTKFKLVFSKWRDKITSRYSQFELVILK